MFVTYGFYVCTITTITKIVPKRAYRYARWHTACFITTGKFFGRV